MTFHTGDQRLPSRFWSKVAAGSDPAWPTELWEERGLVAASCWEWTGSRQGQGYGQFWLEGRTQRSHRVSYEALVGPIPEGLFLDHLCRNTSCCNPEHLEPVSNADNIRRGAISGFRGDDSRKECGRGHALTDDNLVKSKLPALACLECKREQSRAYSRSYHASHRPERSAYAKKYHASRSSGVSRAA